MDEQGVVPMTGFSQDLGSDGIDESGQFGFVLGFFFVLRLFFVIGEDSVEGLERWKDIDELRRLVSFKSYPRTPESSTEIRRLFAENSVTLNEDAKLVEVVRAGLVRKNAFCPCRLPKLPEFFCPCDEFKAQLADPSFHGLCHCRLYRKP